MGSRVNLKRSDTCNIIYNIIYENSYITECLKSLKIQGKERICKFINKYINTYTPGHPGSLEIFENVANGLLIDKFILCFPDDQTPCRMSLL